MVDLIERLRDASLEDAAIHEGYTHILHEAAAEIEALRVEVERQEKLKEKYILQSDGWEHRAIAAEVYVERLEELLGHKLGDTNAQLEVV